MKIDHLFSSTPCYTWNNPLNHMPLLSFSFYVVCFQHRIIVSGGRYDPTDLFLLPFLGLFNSFQEKPLLILAEFHFITIAILTEA